MCWLLQVRSPTKCQQRRQHQWSFSWWISKRGRSQRTPLTAPAFKRLLGRSVVKCPSMTGTMVKVPMNPSLLMLTLAFWRESTLVVRKHSSASWADEQLKVVLDKIKFRMYIHIYLVWFRTSLKIVCWYAMLNLITARIGQTHQRRHTPLECDHYSCIEKAKRSNS